MISIPILLYHDLDSPLCPNKKAGSAARETVVRSSDFEGQVQSLAERGYVGISISDYLACRLGGKLLPPKSAILSFDDGHRSNYDIAFRILKNYNFKGTFFVTAKWIDTPDHLTRAQIREMAQEGMEIGSHGLTHRYMPLLGRDETRLELVESKNILESATGKPVDFFAFPGGHYDRKSLELLPQCGYKGACSCIQGFNREKTDRYLLRRIEVRRRITLRDFESLFDPAKIALYRVVDMWKASLKWTVGIERYASLRAKFYHLYPFKR